MAETSYFGDQAPADSIIEVRVRDLTQLFNSLDPSPFHEKELDRNAEEYIGSNAEELPDKTPPVLVVYLDKPAGLPDEGRFLGDAVRVHFARRAQPSRRALRQLLRRGWISLAVGLVFLAASVGGGESIMRHMGQGPLATVLRESLLIGGWVAMWRPMEIFLHDWWVIRGERQRHERLSRMAVRIVGTGTQPTEALGPMAS